MSNGGEIKNLVKRLSVDFLERIWLSEIAKAMTKIDCHVVCHEISIWLLT